MKQPLKVSLPGVSTIESDKFRLIQILAKGFIPILIDPEGLSIKELHPNVIVDARMRKHKAELIGSAGMVIVGLGPGFEEVLTVVPLSKQAGVIRLGELIQGVPEPDTNLPEAVGIFREERVDAHLQMDW